MGSQKELTQPEGPAQYWFRDNFVLTTDKAHLDPRAINDVFASDLMWWNEPMDLCDMQRMLDNCMTFTVYAVPETEEQMKGKACRCSFSRPKRGVVVKRRRSRENEKKERARETPEMEKKQRKQKRESRTYSCKCIDF
jgi:hypothetical protein